MVRFVGGAGKNEISPSLKSLACFAWLKADERVEPSEAPRARTAAMLIFFHARLFGSLCDSSRSFVAKQAVQLSLVEGAFVGEVEQSLPLLIGFWRWAHNISLQIAHPFLPQCGHEEGVSFAVFPQVCDPVFAHTATLSLHSFHSFHSNGPRAY